MAEITRRDLILMLGGIANVACDPSHHLIRLAGVDLSELDLHGLNLAQADFAGADLRGANLTDARLYGCDFSSADLSGAILRGVYAERAVFAGASLVGVDFEPSERNLFFGTSLNAADFSGSNLTDARLAGADLCAAKFEDALILRADFRGCRVDKDTLLDRAVLHAMASQTRPRGMSYTYSIPPRDTFVPVRISTNAADPLRPDAIAFPIPTAAIEANVAA